MYLRQFKGDVTFHELGVEANTPDLVQTLQVCHIRAVQDPFHSSIKLYHS